MDLDVAHRHNIFGIRKELERPILSGDFVRLTLFAAPNHTEAERLGVPLFQSRGERALGIFADQIEDAGEPGVIFRVQIKAEDAGHQDAVTHLELPQLHIADQLLDDHPSTDLALDFPGPLRHAVHTSAQDIDAGGPAGGSLNEAPAALTDILPPGLRYE
jgi:hypothetical protein